jgi:ATP-dependent DNA ligase
MAEGEREMSRTGIMLAYPFEEKRLEKWGNKFLIQPKLDGDRCRALFDEYGKVTLLSSEENIINSVPHIVQQLEELEYKNLELDGELYTHGTNHQLIHGTVARTVNIHPEFEQIEYHIFDFVSSEPQYQRSLALQKLITVDTGSNIKLVETQYGETIDDIMHGLEYYTENGYEGVILRNLDQPYVRKRSTGIMKFKPRKSDYYIIVGYEEEISIKGEPKNALGALILQSDTEQIFKVGSGSFLTRENREYLWQRKESMINQVAHVKYQHLTERRVPRFPVLIDIIGIA